MKRRQVIRLAGMGALGMGLSSFSSQPAPGKRPLVLSTWYNQSVVANKAAWDILRIKGSALDAVESGVQVCEFDLNNCCVGLGGNPDRDGMVTLDACIMNHKFEIGSVAGLERIKSPVHIARLVMEKTPHVMLVGDGAQKFALEQGAELERAELSDHAQKAYQDWLNKSEYKPKTNIEKEPANINNHDTIGMIAIDSEGNLCGACTTSGMAFKMHGRVGDSPIIGAGLYVDNSVGAATATGHGEEVIRSCGSFLVVQYMRDGFSPKEACKKAIERIASTTPRDTKNIQVGFIALNKKGEFGGYSLKDGFDFGVSDSDDAARQYKAEFISK